MAGVEACEGVSGVGAGATERTARTGVIVGAVVCLRSFLAFRLDRVGSLHSHVACFDVGPWCMHGPCLMQSGVRRSIGWVVEAEVAGAGASARARIVSGEDDVEIAEPDPKVDDMRATSL